MRFGSDLGDQARGQIRVKLEGGGTGALRFGNSQRDVGSRGNRLHPWRKTERLTFGGFLCAFVFDKERWPGHQRHKKNVRRCLARRRY